MLGIQAPRFLPNPTRPLSPPRNFDRPSSRERLGLRSLNYPTPSPSSNSGSGSERFYDEASGNRAMSGGYGSIQPISQYGSAPYGSAMTSVSNPKSMNHTNSWSSLQCNAGYQSSQTSLPASQAQSRAASPEFEPQPSYSNDGLGNSKNGSNNAIHPYLQLPPTISSSGRSISEFAAQVSMHRSNPRNQC